MIPVSKEQVEYLIEVGALTMERGRFPDVTITSRDKKSKRKNRHVAATQQVLKALREYKG